MRVSRLVSFSVLSAALWLTQSGAAAAGPRPDAHGNITAYDHDGRSVLLVVECERGSLGPEYRPCLVKARASAHEQICRPGVGKEIAGKTYYKYRMGAIKTLLSDSVVCSGSGGGDSGGGDSGGGDSGGGDSGGEADDERVGDRRGSSGAYELDGTVIVEKRCHLRSGGKVYDYVRCGQRVRDRAKELICRDKGKGLHKYLYRSGESKPSQSSVFCKR